ncbi:MAG: peroxide stress protein YaaA [Magnetococcales bacterium]|nr:peroxide stress protein YaaA [Magnetococcales bacterium]
MVSQKFDNKTLLIIPCCARKTEGGERIQYGADPLFDFVSPDIYLKMMDARKEILVHANNKFSAVDGYEKNGSIRMGKDFGGNSSDGLYMTALNRYAGSLYSIHGLKQVIETAVSSYDSPKIIILSALYGPLHPLSQIQDYNLKMENAMQWKEKFPPFLKNYIVNNGIRQIILYLGSGSAYFRVIEKAVKGFVGSGVIDKCIQYHVENGNSSTTPRQHGIRLHEDLGGLRMAGSESSGRIIENILRPR